MIISTSLENHSKDDREMLEAVVIKIVVKHLKQMLKYRENIYKIEKKQNGNFRTEKPTEQTQYQNFTYQKYIYLPKNTSTYQKYISIFNQPFVV